MKNIHFVLYPIGNISQNSDNTYVHVYEEYKSALEGLTTGQWIYVFVWFHLSDTDDKRTILKVHPMGNPLYDLCGVFATRSPVRPNPIGLYLVRIKNIDMREGILMITKIDAYENTPIIDIKPYVKDLDYPSANE